MKQKIIEALTTKFGVDAKMLEGIAEKLSKTVTTEEEVATVVEGVTFQQVLESYADKRANEASETARKNAIKKYETQFGLKDGKPVEAPTEEKPAEKPEPKPSEKPGEKPSAINHPSSLPEEVANALKALAEQNKALSEQVTSLSGKIAGIEKKDLTASRRDRLTAAISKLTPAQRKPYARIALDGMSGEEFETFLSEVAADAEAMAKDNDKTKAALDAATNRPTVGTVQVSGKATKDELDSVMKGIH